MKKINHYLFACLLAVSFMCISIFVNADTYTSTITGGNWTDPNTWDQVAVPTAGDDVIIAGPGVVYVNTNGYSCASLTVNTDGILQNGWNANRILTIIGDLTNDGTISITNYSLTLNVEGNLVNNATMTNTTINLTGSSTQYISIATGEEIGCGNLVDTDNTSSVEALTDLTFNGTGIDFNNGELILPATKGGTITLHGGYLYRIELTTNSGTLNMDNGADIRASSTIHNATLEGTVIVRNDNVHFDGETVNNGILQNILNENIDCYIDGNLTNNGTIEEPNYNFYLFCSGNIINNGTWANNFTYLSGTGTHELHQGGSGIFTGSQFIAESTTGNITVSTDFNFNNTMIDLNGVTMELDNSMGANLYIVDKYLRDGTIIGNGQNLYMNNTGINLEGYLANISIENTTLQGIVCVDDGVVFNGNMVVEDTLQTRANENSTITVNDVLTNNGLIRNSNYNLYLNIYGDIINNGEWTNTSITMASSTDQYISCQNGNSFAPTNFYDNDNTSKTIFLDKVAFNGTLINLTNARFDCAGNEFEFLGNTRVINTEIEEAVISGTMYIQGSDVHFYETIINNGVIRNVDNDNLTTYFHGDFINNNTITRSNYNLYVYFYGDVTNNGDWTFSYAHMAALSTQYLTLGASYEFACERFYNDDPLSAVEALTDLTFNGTGFYFNHGQLILPATKGGTITMHGGFLYQIELISNSGSLFMDNGAYLGEQTKIHNATLDGTILLNNEYIYFIGETINNGILQNVMNENVQWVYIQGNLTNNDTIQDSNYDLYLRCYGDITNNGVWSNHYTHMVSADPHELYQGASGEFTGEYFVASDTTGTITVMSDFNFNNTKIDLNGVTLDLDNSMNANLHIIDEYIIDGIITGNGQNLYMNNTGNNSEGFLMNISIENTTLQGIVCVDEGVVFNGNMIVEDTLQTRTNKNSTLTVNDSFTNNGLIRNSNYALHMNIHGDVINNGEWTNTTVTMASSSDQFISCQNGNSFGSYYFYDTDNSSVNICSDNVAFSGTYLNLTGARIDCDVNEIEFIGEVRINNGEFEDAVITGTVYIDDNNVHFYGRTTNNGTIRNVLNNNITTNFHGDVFNNGIITNPNYSLYINCEGHIVNNGTWSNYRTTLNGVDGQLIYLINNQEIIGQVYFDALSAGTPYQWYYEAAVLDSPDFTGETANNLVWTVPVSETWYGDFYCETGAGPSRTITIGGGIIVDLAVILEGAFNGMDMNTTLNDNGHLPLDQPYNMAPWNYSGTESVASMPLDIVDWILVELRETAGGPETATSGTMIDRRALLLRNDGEIVDLNGSPEMKFDIAAVTDNVYMVVWHRNHINVMTADPIDFDISPIVFDYSANEGQVYGGADGHKNLGGGVYGLMGGDADANQEVKDQDKTGFWNPNVGTNVAYETYDFNMDNTVDNKDKNDIWSINYGKETQVPE